MTSYEDLFLCILFMFVFMCFVYVTVYNPLSLAVSDFQTRVLVSRLVCDFSIHHPQASQAKNTWCKGQFVYIENCMEKSPIMKKMCNYLSHLK